MRTKNQFPLILFLIFIIGMLCSHAQAFIHREFTTHEILDACTNIVFGKVKSVDTKRMTAVIDFEENLKGKSTLDEIKINIGIGRYMEGSSPEIMMKLLKAGMPVIMFYQHTDRIESLGYVNGTWFRTRTTDPTGWWTYTHICPYMLRTFTGKTVEFQKVVRAILAGEKWVAIPENAVKVLVLTGNSTSPIPVQSPVPVQTTVSYEYRAIRSVHKGTKRPLAYEATADRALPDSDGVDILWLGQDEIATADDYLLNSVTEKKIKQFVKDGGIVIVSGQKSGMLKMDWLEGNLKSAKRPELPAIKMTEQGKKLFATPNPIQPGQIYIGDTWTDWDKGFEILATTGDGEKLVVGTRKYGKGLYIITSLQNDSQATVKRNQKLIENLLHYAMSRLN